MERRTHYQVSLTAPQALGLFVGLVAALALTYFLGLMTGLSGREEETAPVASTASPDARETPVEQVPVPVRGVDPGAGPRPAAEPTAASAAEPETIQAFDDRPSEQAGAAAAPAPTAASGATGDGFWVQVFSLSSAREARQKSVALASRGYPARVLEAAGSRGSLWRVRVGPYATREQAEAAARKLKAEEKAEPWIVPQGQ